MSELITIQDVLPIALPEPRVEISIRAATLADLSFIDGLQKKTSKMVGFMPTKQIEGKIEKGEVLVASGQWPVVREVEEASSLATGNRQLATGPVVREVEEASSLATGNRQLATGPVVREDEEASSLATGNRQLATVPVGYLIGQDRYFKRDDVGIICAINVVPEYRRSLVAASLLKAQFERSAYGCRLYCCWCAQDLEANRFWESLGFVPLAFRAGSEKKARTHIFWQKRIRSGDVTTPWWFPSKTTGGSIREDRIVLPIPPGTHWSDAKPMILPAEETPLRRVGFNPPSSSTGKKSRGSKPTLPKAVTPRNGLLFDIPQPGEALPEVKAVVVKEKLPRVKKKTDPRLAAAARELRDRWLEEMNASPIGSFAKYDVTRVMESTRPAALPLASAKLLAA